MIAFPKPAIPSPVRDSPPDAHHHRRKKLTGVSHHRRRKANHKLYLIVTLICVVASILVLALEKLPGWMSGTFDQAVEKSMQSEIRKQTKGVEGLSDKQKEALQKAMERQGTP